jgi:hypothetical protein
MSEINELFLKEAKEKILPLGYKPEDYHTISDPKIIAAIVADEYWHLQKMHERRQQLQRYDYDKKAVPTYLFFIYLAVAFAFLSISFFVR